MFHDILQRKNVFLEHKNEMVEGRKSGIFPIGLVHSFGQKFLIFPPFILGKENVFINILEETFAFVDHKKKKLILLKI